MKRQSIAITVTLIVLLATSVAGAIAQSKSKEKTVKGEVVDLWCYLDDGSRGASHKECATTCAKAGNPIGIVDAKGNIYVAMGSNDHQPGRELLIDKMSETVTVTGKLVKKGGMQVLYISSVK
ncbi:MAG: hypothetical protein HY033_13735 [Ignavibacteriae bacterium]|nr:hypothetical protein [Ignavibacteria bacterium]MBI3365953.1 hypothetical protein [Ignavibacteriota bacterium]